VVVSAVANHHPHHPEHHRSAHESAQGGEDRQPESGRCDHEHDSDPASGNVQPVVYEKLPSSMKVHE
jgi:hypothetical protein